MLFMSTSKNKRKYEGKTYIFVSDGEKIGSGGNGNVYKVNCNQLKGSYVVKQLKNNAPMTKKRFSREIETIVKINKEYPDQLVVRCVDYGEDWYAMPELNCLTNHMKEKRMSFDEKIKIIKSLADDLKKLHALGYSHRDIKPGNIFVNVNGDILLGDLGLVWNEAYEDWTRTSEGLGPVDTRPPECRRGHAKEIPDGSQFAIDVYEFAKTAWMILKSAKYCFEGQYNYGDNTQFIQLSDLGIGDKDLIKTIGPVHELLEAGTAHLAALRPTMAEVCDRLNQLNEVNSNIELVKQFEWKINFKRAMASATNDIVGFTNIIVIESVLNRLRHIAKLMLKEDWSILVNECIVYDKDNNVILIKDNNNNSYFINVKTLYLDQKGDMLEANRLFCKAYNIPNAESLDDIYNQFLPGVPINVKGRNIFINSDTEFVLEPII